MPVERGDIIVRIILFGDMLNPEQIADALALDVTSNDGFWKKGEVRGKLTKLPARTGMLSFKRRTSVLNICEHVGEILKRLKAQHKGSLLLLPGVEDALLDIYIEREDYCGIDLEAAQIADMSDLGLRLACTWGGR